MSPSASAASGSSGGPCTKRALADSSVPARPQGGDDDVVPGRPEAVSVGRVDEAPEQVLDAGLPVAMGGHGHVGAGLVDEHLAAAVQRHANARLERLRPVVGDVQGDPVEPLVDGPDRDRRQRAAQMVPCGLGRRLVVEHAPARAGYASRSHSTSAPAQTEPGRRHSPKVSAITSPVTSRERST